MRPLLWMALGAALVIGAQLVGEYRRDRAASRRALDEIRRREER